MRKLAILGASGHGKVVADTAELCGWDTIEFFDDAWPTLSRNGCWVVSGTSLDLIKRVTEFTGVIIAIGNNSIRQSKLLELAACGGNLVTLLHPASIVSRYAKIGVGTVVFAGAVVNAGASVGMGCILNTGCSVDHDCKLGDAVHVSPGSNLAGAVVVGERSWIGIGASVKQQVRLGESVIVGAGAAVVGDVSSGLTVVGVPARPYKLK